MITQPRRTTRPSLFVFFVLFPALLFADTRDFLTRLGDPLPELPAELLESTEDSKATFLYIFDPEIELGTNALSELERFIWEPLGAEGLRMVAVARGASPSRAKETASEYGVTFSVVPDPERALAGLFSEGGAGVPRAVIADSGGTIVYQHPGYQPGREAEYRYVLERALRGEPIPPLGGRAQSFTSPAARTTTVEAARDVVGQKAPELHVEEWITAEPPATEGKYLLYEFWATWCPPCRMTMPHLQKISEEFAGKIVVLSISDEDAQTVRDYLAGEGFTYPIGIDTQNRTAGKLAVRAIPHALIIDPEGTVVWQGNPLDLYFDDALLPGIIGE